MQSLIIRPYVPTFKETLDEQHISKVKLVIDIPKHSPILNIERELDAFRLLSTYYSRSVYSVVVAFFSLSRMCLLLVARHI